MSVLGKGSMTKFTFAQSPEGFDKHIENSVRGYTNLWHDILAMSKYFAEDDTYIVDLGCSSGKLLKNMIDYNKDHIPNAKYVGIEIEDDFAVGHGDDLMSGKWPNLYFEHMDAREYTFHNCSMVTSIFTLREVNI